MSKFGVKRHGVLDIDINEGNECETLFHVNRLFFRPLKNPESVMTPSRWC